MFLFIISPIPPAAGHPGSHMFTVTGDDVQGRHEVYTRFVGHEVYTRRFWARRSHPISRARSSWARRLRPTIWATKFAPVMCKLRAHAVIVFVCPTRKRRFIAHAHLVSGMRSFDQTNCFLFALLAKAVSSCSRTWCRFCVPST